MNLIAIIELSGRQPEFMEYLRSKAFYSKWTNNDNSVFTLPSNCVWGKFTPKTENESDTLSEAVRAITEHSIEFNKLPGNPIVVEKVLVLPAKKWAALSDQSPAFGGWKDAKTQSDFDKFKAIQLEVLPNSTEMDIRNLFLKLSKI